MASNIALVATDMDGTLLDGEGKVPAGFEAWVVAHPAVRVVIASGRQIFTLQEQFSSLANKLIFIADNGSVVMERDQLIYSNSMDPTVVRQAVKLATEHTDAIVVLCGLKSAYIAAAAQDVARRNIEQYYARHAYPENPLEALAYDEIIKIALFCEKGNAFEASTAMGELPQGLKSVVSGECWIDIANETVNKGVAITRIQNHYGIAPGACMAFGDYLNDKELLEACGESYAMENAIPAIKAVAKHLAPANTENGVMQILAREFDSL